MEQVLHNKTCIPGPLHGELERKGLATKINEWDSSSVQVVTLRAPAGYGKTAFLAQWSRCHRSKNQEVAWVSLDTFDNDSMRFWNIVGYSILGQKWKYPTSELDPVSVIEHLVEHLAATPLKYLIVDNVEVLTNKSVLAELDFFITNLPKNSFVVFSGRALPGLDSVRRLDLEQKVGRLSVRDFLVSKQEANSLCCELDLNVSLLLEAAEGWIAPIAFARSHTSQITSGNSTKIRELLSDFYEPLFETYSAKTQEALVIMSIIEPFSGSDLNFITNQSADAELLINSCQQETGMLIFDKNINKYRIHRTLGHFISFKEKSKTLPDSYNIHRKSSSLRSEQGNHTSALAHAISTNDRTFILETLDRSALPLFWHDRLCLNSDLFASDSLDSIPEISLLKSFLEFNIGNREPAMKWLEDHFSIGAPTAIREEFAPLGFLLHARMLISKGRFNDALRVIDLAQIDSGVPALRLHASSLRASALIYLGRNNEAQLLVSELLAESRYGEHPALAIDLVTLAAALQFASNDYRKAQNLALESARIARDHGLKYHPRSLAAHLISAWCDFLRMDDNAATSNLQFIRFTHFYPEVFFDASRRLSLVMNYPESTNKTLILDEFEPLVLRLFANNYLSAETLSCSLHLAEMLLWAKRKTSISHLKEELRKHFGNCGEYYLISAWELITADQISEARRLVNMVTSQYAPCASAYGSTLAWGMQAAIAGKENSPIKEREAFKIALGMAVKHGTLRVFTLISPEARSSLLVHRDHLREFKLQIDLIAQFKCEGAISTGPILTSREVELLRLLPSLATTSELADDLQISVNTVKTHIKSIYRKLDAGTRREAITNARILGLFEATG